MLAASSHARRPKEITEIKAFLTTARRKDAKNVKVFSAGKVTKFKIRCNKVRGAAWPRRSLSEPAWSSGPHRRRR